MSRLYSRESGTPGASAGHLLGGEQRGACLVVVVHYKEISSQGITEGCIWHVANILLGDTASLVGDHRPPKVEGGGSLVLWLIC